jgi:hypothetical protein
MPSASTRSKMVGIRPRELIVGGPTGECIEGELGDPLVGCIREGQIPGREHLSAPAAILPAMGQQLERVTAAAVEVVDPAGLAARAAEVAACQRSPETRRTYAAVYRSFSAFLGPDAQPADVMPEAVRAYRDALEHAGRSPASSTPSRPAASSAAAPDAPPLGTDTTPAHPLTRRLRPTPPAAELRPRPPARAGANRRCTHARGASVALRCDLQR